MPLVTMAHGPTPQKIVETIEIAAPVEKVWAIAGDFGGVSQWDSLLKSSEATNGNQPGSSRTLVFANGEALKEDLDSYDAAKHEYQYRMGEPNVKAIPASSYSVVFRITATEKGSQVEWKSRAHRGDTGNEPPQALNDEAVTSAMQKFFSTGLGELKTKAENSQ
jgi:mxaD protein